MSALENDVPLDEESWNVLTSLPMMYSLVAGEELAAMADERDDILVLTADLMTSNRTGDFRDRHPDRFYNLGIAEQNMMSVAAGLATCGYVPYVSTFASFASLLCAEHIRTDLAYPALPVRILAHHAGVAMGFYGTSHHATEDIALLRAIPGLTVVSASDATSLRALLRATVDTPGPVYVRMGRGRERPVHDEGLAPAAGRFHRLRDGRDLTIVATGLGVRAAMEAAEELASDGIEAAVLDALWLKPFDDAAVLQAARETGGILTVEEHSTTGGLGGAVSEVLAQAGAAVPFARHGMPDEYALVAPPTHLYRHYGLTGQGVAERARALLDGRADH